MSTPSLRSTICPSCGATAPADHRFCMSCGATIFEHVNVQTPLLTTPNSAAISQSQPAVAPAAPTYSAQAQDLAYKSCRRVIIAAFFLIGLFFSPFVSCSSEDVFTGVEAFKQSVDLQLGMDEQDSTFAIGLTFILFPLAGAVGLAMGLKAWKAITTQEPITNFGMITLLAAATTALPMFITIRAVLQSEGMWQLEWGFYGSIVAALMMFVSARGMISASKQQP